MSTSAMSSGTVKRGVTVHAAYLSQDVVDSRTGELLATTNDEISEDQLAAFRKAGRTGRYGGRVVQLQNLARPAQEALSPC